MKHNQDQYTWRLSIKSTDVLALKLNFVIGMEYNMQIFDEIVAPFDFEFTSRSFTALVTAQDGKGKFSIECLCKEFDQWTKKCHIDDTLAGKISFSQFEKLNAATIF